MAPTIQSLRDRPVRGSMILREVRLERPIPARSSMQSLAEATLSWIGEESLERAVGEAISALLADDSGVTARGTPTVAVRPAPDNVRVRVPLRIVVPGSFDANADLDLRMTVTAWNGVPSVWLYQFEVDVSWAAWRDTLSLGAVETILRRLLRGFLEDALERHLVAALDEAVRLLCPLEEGQHLHSMWNDERVIRFRCCPASERGLPITLRAFPEVDLGGSDLAAGFGG